MFLHLLICKALWISNMYELCYINKPAFPLAFAFTIALLSRVYNYRRNQHRKKENELQGSIDCDCVKKKQYCQNDNPYISYIFYILSLNPPAVSSTLSCKEHPLFRCATYFNKYQLYIPWRHWHRIPKGKIWKRLKSKVINKSPVFYLTQNW